MDLNGTWYNELGSAMNLIVGPDGAITGLYETGVGNASGQYPIGGRAEIGPSSEDDQNLAFGVSWQNDSGDSDSATAWSGQVQQIDGVAIMRTTWLLTMETEPGEDWQSTLIGHDMFTQTQPSAETVANAKKFGKRPYPIRALRS